MVEKPEALFRRWLDAINRQDRAAMRSMLHPEFVDEMPQTGERTRGIDNMLAILDNYPDADRLANAISEAHIYGAEDRWAMAANFTLVQVVGTADVYTATARIGYPDGSTWYMVILVGLKDGLIHRTTTFYAPLLPAPGWRAAWVERMDQPSA